MNNLATDKYAHFIKIALAMDFVVNKKLRGSPLHPNP